jgi:4-hydroxybenzoate polyprenyltransferase
LLYEGLVFLLKNNPLQLFFLPFWLLKGRAYLKQQIAARVAFDVATLPYHRAFLKYLEEEKAAGRRVVLVTASDRVLAEKVAAHLSLFDSVIASNGRTNLSGRHKRNALIQVFGANGFDYAGNAHSDVSVYAAARKAIIVNGDSGVAARARQVAVIEHVFEERLGRLGVLLRALRLQQWSKNVLIFVPLVTSHQLLSAFHLWPALLAFLSFSLCASAVYLINDLADLQADRNHWKKKFRPFAAGELQIATGLRLIPVLLLAAVAVGYSLGTEFLAILATYFALTLAYSLYVKRKLLLDVYVLGALYTLRVLAGSAATGIACSAWLLAFSMFFFVSLALIKRFTEFQQMDHATPTTRVKGRGYWFVDAQAVACLGTGSSFLSVLILTLYINSPQVTSLYTKPVLLWLLCPLLMYWLSRMWVISGRGNMDVDPVVFALKDKVSYLVGLCTGAILLLASSNLPILSFVR